MQTTYQNLTSFANFNPLNHTQLWLATDSFSQKKVLIKQLKQGFNSTQFEQFYQEYQVYQKIATLAEAEKIYFAEWLDFYQQNSEYFLVLTFYQGKTLKQPIAESTLSFSQKITLLIKICEAVEILHTLGFIHCDIKPSNILVIDDQVKLLDFGLAKKVGEQSNANSFTAGTPAYMSPEQFTGGQMTYQSDYYSLGVVLYETLVGEQPFYAPTLEGWAIKHCQMPIPSISHFQPEINQPLQCLLNPLLAKFAVNRPQNLIETVQGLKNLLKV